MSILDRITEGMKIYAALEMARLSIKDAPIGGVVDCGVARRIKIFTREIDLPLQPLVRK